MVIPVIKHGGDSGIGQDERRSAFYLLNEVVSNSGCLAEDDQMRVNTALAKDMEGDDFCE